MRRIGELFAPPEQPATRSFQSHQCPVRTTRRHHHLISIDQRRFSEPPIRAVAAKIPGVIFAPKFLPAGAIVAGQLTPLTGREYTVPVDRRCAARTSIAAPARRAPSS